jgi:flavin reductase (DIM6/NTAB) family NADH-FMN oxidoreductase RutF
MGRLTDSPRLRLPAAGPGRVSAENKPAAVDIRPFMSGFPTGVGVVTAMTGDLACWGMTCTSVCSVSLRPPTLLVCLREGSPTLRAVLDTGCFALNLLRASARRTAELFASGAPDRFARVRWESHDGQGGPHLVDDAHTIADCRVTSAELVGDHRVVFGEVVAITQRCEPRPLLYGLRRYADWPAARCDARDSHG